jgi:hypothetical protein
MPRLLVPLILLLFTVVPAAAQVGDPLAPHTDWRTLRTAHFDVHYPAEAEAWTLPVAARLDSMHVAVTAMVGNAPPRRTTVVVADPFNVSNGFAIPFLRTPTMVLWTTPPEPRSGIGEHRGWGELLAVHEYAHLAHLAWPSRNARERRLWSLLPVQLGPVTRRSPRWAIEGYATLIEGRLTGSGRPHGTWRPTTLRQWALEGRLPTYAQLSAWDAYQGGAMAYLVGSAYLDWLVEQRGEESLNHVWRRMSAVQRRGFADAFAGVFGAPPDELYGRFTVELIREALEAERLLGEVGLAEGEQFQRLSGHTGDISVSPDGERMALVLRPRGQPSRIVVWSTDPPEPLVREEERERLLARDPEDVPAIDWRPRSKEALARLDPVARRPHDHPRWMPDGRHVLVTRAEPLSDGRLRPDLFLWDTERGTLRRITRGAGVRHADPAPDGRTAVGVRCEGGICDLVRVDLRTGALRVLHAATPDVVFYRPRVSPDGVQVVVAVQADGRWRLMLTDLEGGPLAAIDPDDGHNRYDAAWLRGGEALIAVSHRGGVANLERIDPAGAPPIALTRTSSAALAPVPLPDGGIFFLRLTTRGLDVHHLSPDAIPAGDVVDLEPRLAFTAPSPAAEPADAFPAALLPSARPYGLGPRTVRLLPAGGWSAEGGAVAAALAGTDPIGRLGWTAAGALGDPGVWRGGGFEAVWRGVRPSVRGNLWWARQHATRQPSAPVVDPALDVDYGGAALWLEAQRAGGTAQRSARIGASWGRLDDGMPGPRERRLVFADAETSLRLGDRTFVEPSITLHGSAGRTGGGDWQRGMGSIEVVAGRGGFGVVARATGGVVSSDAQVFEHFVVGGADPLVFDGIVLPQRLAFPALPLGTLRARNVAAVQAGLRLGAVEPTFWAFRSDEGVREWYRLVGAHREFRIGPAPLARLPEVRIVGGAAAPLDEPHRHRLRGYLSLHLRP